MPHACLLDAILWFVIQFGTEAVLENVGGAEGIRTPDPPDAIGMLSPQGDSWWWT